MTTNIFLGLLLIGIGFLIFRKKELNNDTGIIEENARIKADLSQKEQSINELKGKLQNEKTEKDQLFGKHKQLSNESDNLKAENKIIRNNEVRLIKEVSDFKASEENRMKEFNDKIQKLDEVKITLEDEKQRIRREDEEKIKRETEERDRVWNIHEENVKAKLAELCKDPRYGFQYYDNNNLPEGFGGKFKPDFLIEFSKEYVIFDAKMSRSDDLQNYINTQKIKLVEKINDNKEISIYSTIFFIVPTDAMKSLKKISFYEQGYDFFVISPEAIEIVLASFKKISTYETMEKWDPQDRKSIINLIAEFDYHINMRNALDILASASGVSVLKTVGNLPDDIQGEISIKKGEKRLERFTPTEIKDLMVSTGVQREKIIELILPKADIPENNLRNVMPILGKKKNKHE